MMAASIEIFQRKARTFLPETFVLKDWPQVEPYMDLLLQEPLDTVEQVEAWLAKSGEFEAVINEDGAWRYISMTRDTNNLEHRQRYEQFITEILPHLSVKQNELLRKLYHSAGFVRLDPAKYKVLIRSVRNRIELFREENVALSAEMMRRAREFDTIAASLHIEHEGQKLTLQKASSLLEQKDRAVREEVWKKITGARLAHREALDALLTDLIGLRTQVGQNAGYDSFADYKFMDLGRFDYTRADAFAFHHAVETIVTPELVRRSRERARKLGVDVLRPWDLSVDESGRPPLNPFRTTDELIEGVIRIFDRIDPRLAANIRTMRQMGHLDLDARLGKAPGGYNYSLAETGVPYIFMNAVGMQSDLVVMLHEIGHAVHSFATRDLVVSEFKHLPSEIAELASMSMEFITLDYLDEFYSDPADVQRARRDQVMRPISLLPWIASIDAFQFWLHDNPGHSVAEREAQWTATFKRFHGDYVSWEGHEEVLASLWQKQGHVFEVPFYYIEYGIAQLGAAAVWRNYRLDPAKCLDDYLAALALGNSRTIPEVYARAGVRFDFSEDYVRELIRFMVGELASAEVSA